MTPTNNRIMTRFVKGTLFVLSIVIFAYSVMMFRIGINASTLEIMKVTDPSLRIFNSVFYLSIFSENFKSNPVNIYNILLLFSISNLIITWFYFKNAEKQFKLSQVAIANAVFFTVLAILHKYVAIPTEYADVNRTVVSNGFLKVIISVDEYFGFDKLTIPDIVIPCSFLIILLFSVSMMLEKSNN